MSAPEKLSEGLERTGETMVACADIRKQLEERLNELEATRDKCKRWGSWAGVDECNGGIIEIRRMLALVQPSAGTAGGR